MDFFETAKKRRSVRQFKASSAVSNEDVRVMLETAIMAPSAGNTQCARFFVVRTPELKHRLATEAGHQIFIEQAPVVIVVAADLNVVGKGYGERGRNTYALQDTAAAVQNMLLAATALGYGACWIGAFDEAKAAQILDLPEHVRPLAMIPIGVSAEPGSRVPTRKSVEDVTRFV